MVWLLPEKSVLGQTGKVNTAGFSIGLTIGLLFVMGLLFYWLTRLSRMMARLSTYLAEKSFSDLEVMHVHYVSTFPKDVSQRATMATVFLVLGLFAASLLSAFLIWGPYAFDAASPIQPQVWWLLLTLALLIYISIVGYLGFRNTWEDRAALENRWKEVFRQAKSSG